MIEVCFDSTTEANLRYLYTTGFIDSDTILCCPDDYSLGNFKNFSINERYEQLCKYGVVDYGKRNKEYFYNGGIDLKKLYIVIIGLVICAIGIVVFFKFKNNSLDETLKEAKSINSYQLVCDMEMTQNDELKSYEVKVDYLKKDKQKYYRVELYDKSLNQSQIIIKNKKGVYVLTPTLNQMFKFQSDWPENSPKPYIYHYLIQLLENNKVKKIEKGYQVEAKVKYPNDTRIVKQEVIFDKKLKPLIVLCLDQDETEIVTCKVNEFHKNKNFKEKHFNQNQALKESKKDVKTSANNDVLYPVSLLGAKLESETVSSIEGDKNHILKFSGDKSFTMVETQVNDQQVMQFSNDEVIDLIDGFAYYQPGKLSMMYHGMMCSLYSQDLTKEEMLSVMTSMQTSSTK